MQLSNCNARRFAGRSAKGIILGLCAAVAGCNPGGDGTAAVGVVSVQPAASPTPTATSPLVGDARKSIRIGNWRELLIKADGTIDAAEYRRVAANYNSPEIMDYRLGPTAADFAGGKPQATAPTIWGPDMTSGQGLWPFGTQPLNNPGEPEKCLPPSQQPRSDAEENARGLAGAGWLVGGQHLFLPDNPNDPDYRYGIANTRGADGAVFNTGGLCMRMIASWNYDWWNRNGIAQPFNTQVRDFAATHPDLPLVPVAMARGRANASQISFTAFRDGRIIPIAVGNTAPEFFDPNGVQLPAGMVPTGLAVTPYNEFLVATVWDTNSVSGKLAIIALRPRQMAVGGPGQTPNTRWYWGLPGAWTIRGMKLLGMVDLPFAAPSSVDVTNHVVLGNPRGFGDNDDPAVGDLSRQSARDIWRGVTGTYVLQNQWQQAASTGYAVVASRAENRVAFVDMGPLYQYYREMYFTTQANYDLTADMSTTAAGKWPFTFDVEPRQRPVVASTIAVAQPTSVSAGTQTNSIFGIDRSTWYLEYGGTTAYGVTEPRTFARRQAYVATMSGAVQIFNVRGISLPGETGPRTVPTTPVRTFQVGRNPSFMFTNGLSTAPDDLFLVSRGDRSVTFAFPSGHIQSVLRDSRLVDPVAGAVSYNTAGYGGSGPGRSVFTMFLSITDYNGKAILTYAVDPKRGFLGEYYPFNTPDGPAPFLFGSVAPFPGKPFMIDMEEII